MMPSSPVEPASAQSGPAQSEPARSLQGRAIVIAGPTASGKSRLALALAERCVGVVINADSMQVYRELSILTARPTAQEEARAPHALYGFVGGAEAYSAGRYAADAARAIAEARAGGRVPILVGGTGLYFKALLEGLSPVPAADPEVRAYWRGQAAQRPANELHALLAEREPGKPVLAEAETVRLLLMPDRDLVGSRIDARFDAMLVEGAVEEVRRLL